MSIQEEPRRGSMSEESMQSRRCAIGNTRRGTSRFIVGWGGTGWFAGHRAIGLVIIDRLAVIVVAGRAMTPAQQFVLEVPVLPAFEVHQLVETTLQAAFLAIRNIATPQFNAIVIHHWNAAIDRNGATNGDATINWHGATDGHSAIHGDAAINGNRAISFMVVPPMAKQARRRRGTRKSNGSH